MMHCVGLYCIGYLHDHLPTLGCRCTRLYAESAESLRVKIKHPHTL